jgi:hypothetical protein
LAFYVAKADTRGRHRLSDACVKTAANDVALQFSRADVRLALLLNRVLGR